MQFYKLGSQCWIHLDGDLNFSNLLTPSIFFILASIVAIQNWLRWLFRFYFRLFQLLFLFIRPLLFGIHFGCFLLNDISLFFGRLCFLCFLGLLNFFIKLFDTSLRNFLVVLLLILVHYGKDLHIFVDTSCLL